MQEKMKLNYLIQTVLDVMADKKFCSKIIKDYRNSFNHLKRLAEKMGTDQLTEEMISTFQGDAINTKTGKYSWTKERHRIRCVRLLTSLAEKGVIDWSKKKIEDASNKLTEPSFRLILEKFISHLDENGLRPNTIDG